MSTDDFRRRTFRFGILVARLVQTLSKAEVARVIGNQLLRSGIAVGENYLAAARPRSRADVIAKLGIVEEEGDETLYWIDMLIELELVSGTSCKELRAEANEILAIVVASIRTARRNIKQPMRYTNHG
ncbi:MAG: four helix bundle protein [Verrucomicrobia bacterium]|nr:MAG: four helix bundle protein [Verrucomicrobiota bacterium]